MDIHERVYAAVESLLRPLGYDLVDVEILGSGRARTVRLRIDRPGGVDLDAVTEATRLVSPALDAVEGLPGPYTLEVSSPGVERPLRSPDDFRRAAGTTISLKSHDDVEGERRHRGVLSEVDEEGFVVLVGEAPRRFRYSEVAQARTVLEWGPRPKPGRGRGRSPERATARSEVARAGSPGERER